MDKPEIEIGGVAYQSQERSDGFCFGCTFYDDPDLSKCDTANRIQRCTPAHRADGKAVIWVLK